jgi:hypothetical protein
LQPQKPLPIFNTYYVSADGLSMYSASISRGYWYRFSHPTEHGSGLDRETALQPCLKQMEPMNVKSSRTKIRWLHIRRQYSKSANNTYLAWTVNPTEDNTLPTERQWIPVRCQQPHSLLNHRGVTKLTYFNTRSLAHPLIMANKGFIAQEKDKLNVYLIQN